MSAFPLTAAWTAGGIVLYILAPLSAPILLPLAMAAPLAWYFAAERRIPFYWPEPVTILLGLAVLYLFVNASWSLRPGTAYLYVGLLLIYIATQHATLNLLHEIDTAALRAMALGLAVGVAVAGAILCVEMLTDQWVRRSLADRWPFFNPGTRFVENTPDGLRILPEFANHNIAALTLLVWPAAFILDRLHLIPRRPRWAYLALAPAVAAIFLSSHATSKMAVLGAAAVYVLFQVWPGLTRRVALTGWIVATLFVVPLCTLAYSNKLYLLPWLPHSAQHRIVIWGHTSEQVAKAPLFGAGVATARGLHQPHNILVPKAPNSEFRLSTGIHSHNAYLQTWFEAGAVGALLLLSIGLLVLQAISRSAIEVQKHPLAIFTACALMGASSFSLWAPWLLASFSLVAIFAGLALALPRPQEIAVAGRAG